MEVFNSDDNFSSTESEEDYINMEVHHHHDSPFANIFKEFEFQSFSSSSEKDPTTTSPADELFYMGKLLPLHLPPRLEMVQKIFQTKIEKQFDEIQESFVTPLSSNTPFQSCNISPSDSCHISRELNTHEYFHERTTAIIKEKKSWTKRLKWASLKSFFSTKSADDHNHRRGPGPKTKQRSVDVDYEFEKIRMPFGQIKYKKRQENYKHRKSFSGAFREANKTCSDSISNSNILKRSCSNVVVGSELDNPIQAAIAHCKRSQDPQQYLFVFKK